MIAFILAWITISFVLISWGEMFVSIYNKLCKQSEQYNLIDKLLLGLSLLIIPLSVWSLWLPSNHYFLFVSTGISIAYWFVRRKYLQKQIKKFKSQIKELSKLQLGIIILAIMIILCSSLWVEGVFDSVFYHHQNIRWNEQYSVVPGLGNLDDRFAFNSNYLLISAMFTFRFLFGEAIYPLQSCVLIFFVFWIFHELFTSKYEIKRTILLFSFVLFYFVNIKFLLDTSTDILPNLIAYYLIAKIILYPDFIKKNYLLGLAVPIFAITCKLSIAPFILISGYILFRLVKERNYRPLFFALAITLLIVTPWLIRNVILSGYLIYPFSGIDLFSFDWKIPAHIGIKQQEYIKHIGDHFFNAVILHPAAKSRDPLWINLLTTFIYILTTISLITASINLWIRRKQIEISAYIVFGVICIILITWFMNGPDARFVHGILAAAIMTGGASFFLTNKRDIHTPKLSVCIISLFLILSTGWSAKRTQDKYTTLTEVETNRERPFSSIIYRPYPYDIYLGIDRNTHFKPYSLNNGIIIYISSSYHTYDMLPATTEMGDAGKLCNYKCLEARGHSLQDGFRLKVECED
ncbi:hypothetical protein [Dysgonomonas sp. ZJ709]|uniref:LIC_10190 family membrane protein n=1 Tax=Dysgonomonas sp. ZJ709 TaxID=2709797 RepID=UPI0013ECA2A0|nr:hypothetical protein [Dysgonomonas sp. ZJ709]